MLSPEPRTDFRFSQTERFGIALATALIWLMLAGMVAAAMRIFLSGDWVNGLILAGVSGLSVRLVDIVLRDCRMKWRWRILLEEEQALLILPAGRLLFGQPPACAAVLPYPEISHLEWREEMITSLWLRTVNRIYAVRLKSGELIILGEDRPIPKTSDYTRLTSDAAHALARAAGVPLRQRKAAHGKSRFLAFWNVIRPDWPDYPSDRGGKIRGATPLKKP